MSHNIDWPGAILFLFFMVAGFVMLIAAAGG